MMANPELVRRMMMSNPQTREVMENNPEVAQMLNDPSFLRQVRTLLLKYFMFNQNESRCLVSDMLFWWLTIGHAFLYIVTGHCQEPKAHEAGTEEQ